MKIAVFGATGKTGQALVTQALAAGHEVAALVRDPAKLDPRAGLTIVVGDAGDSAAVTEVLAGSDAAISLLGNFNRKPNTEVSDATRILLAAAAERGVRRIVVTTTIGTGGSFRQLKSWPFKLIIRTVAREIWRDRERQEAVVFASALDWTVVRPGGLTDQPATGRWTLVGGDDPQPKKVSITRADVAAALLQVAADPATIRKTLCLFTEPSE